MITLLLFFASIGLFINANTHTKGKKFVPNNRPRPNVEDVKRVYKQTVSPYYEKPYIPLEVDKLTEESNIIKRDLSKFMTKAEIVGPAPQKGVEENPIMYSTVIDRHPTSITHPTLKPEQIVLRNGGGEALFDDKIDANEKGYENVIKGGSIPVQIRSNVERGAATENLENPIFIHKSEKIQTSTEKVENINALLSNQVNAEVGLIRNQMKIANNKREKIRVLKEGGKRLRRQARELSAKIQSGVKEILDAKEVAGMLNNVLTKYENTMQRNEASRLRLVDVVEVKKQLKLKLLKEMQGIRTSDNDFKAIAKVNPRDVKRVMREIKRKLGLN